MHRYQRYQKRLELRGFNEDAAIEAEERELAAQQQKGNNGQMDQQKGALQKQTGKSAGGGLLDALANASLARERATPAKGGNEAEAAAATTTASS